MPDYIAKESSYHSISQTINELIGKSNNELAVLAPTYAHLPSWTFPSDVEVIPHNVNTVFVVDRSKPFLIALLRTHVEDRPLLIGQARKMNVISKLLTISRVARG
jgi:hypothetical protein